MKAMSTEFNRDILDLNAPVVFFPARHHSPMGAKLLQQLVHTLRPAAILIEGPSDFNDRMAQLTLPHQLPIAIYSYAHLANGTRRGAFYPYCEYSPEWQAIQTASSLNIPARFIDLPWSAVAATAVSNHRYAETALHQSRYVRDLADKLGIEGLDNLWDQLFEIDRELTLAEYLERCHQFCFHCRLLDGCLSESDRQREAFMASHIRQAMTDYSGQVLVVTGGYHSYALYAQVFDQPLHEPAPPAIPPSVAETIEQIGDLQLPASETLVTHQGAALTPFSYERLDSLSGYDAGMPSPGFYHQVWQARGHTHDRPAKAGSLPSLPYRQLFTQVVSSLRQQRQVVSAADLIAVETMAQSLAALRGHAEIWRQDILDAITGALIKEAIHPEQPHPFLQAVQQVFQGQQRGQLARGTALPPLARHIHAVLSEFDLTPQGQGRAITLNLYHEEQRQRSQILHQLRILQISGYRLNQSCGWVAETERLTPTEEWLIRWSPEFEASCIENAIYGCTLAEAAAARLQEVTAKSTPSAEQATKLLLESFLMGLPRLTAQFQQQLTALIQLDNNFFTLAGALDPLLFLYRYDDVLGTADHSEIGELLAIAYQRALWLLGNLGTLQGNPQQLLQGIKALLSTFERCGQTLGLRRELIVQAFTQISNDTQRSPLLRGAAIGALWRLAASSEEKILQELGSVATPEDLGDFLTGLFHLAREVTQRSLDLLKQIDRIIAAFDENAFLEALPSLHLAFTYFTPREKHEISHTLVSAWGLPEESSSQPAVAEVTPEIMAQAQAMEANALSLLTRYGLRGGQK